MKHLKLFSTDAAYQTFKDSEDFVLPNVSFVQETNSVAYNPYIETPMNVITYYANEKLTETTDTEFTPGLHINAFNCAITSHEFADGVGTITFEEDITTIGDYAFESCFGLTEIIIPDSVTSIGSGAFKYCRGLISITISDSVTSIGDGAFRYCSGLTSITCYAPTAPSILNTTFRDIKSNGTLYYPSDSDYSSWLSTDSYYLGYYNWTVEYI